MTGLVDRDAFARAVDQADRDRDRLLLAVITVDGLAEVNQLCGYDAGDRLLGCLGRALAMRTSVDVTVGRTGGGQLGFLVTPFGDHDPTTVFAPVLVDLNQAVDDWIGEQAALGTPSPVLPQPRVGVATGYGGGTWSDAEVALAVAQGDPDGPDSIHFDLSDPRLAAHRRRQRLADELVEAVHQECLPIDISTIEELDRNIGATGHDGWLRLRPRLAGATRDVGIDDGEVEDGEVDDGGLTPADLSPAPGLAGRLDGHLLARAADLGAGQGPSRVSVPLFGPLRGPRSALSAPAIPAGDQSSVPAAPTGIVVEADQTRLLRLAETEGQRATLADRLDRLGWELAVTGFDGGWAAWSLLDRYPIHHLRPRTDLIRAALAGDPTADRLLLAAWNRTGDGAPRLTANIDAISDEASPVSDARLRAIGLTHIERSRPA